MRYLTLLLLLIGCNSTPLYKEGDCIRIYSTNRVMNFIILEIFKDRYVVSPAFMKDNESMYLPSERFVFSEYILDGRSRKISCTNLN